MADWGGMEGGAAKWRVIIPQEIGSFWPYEHPTVGRLQS